MELRVRIDDAFVEKLQKDLGQDLKLTDIVREALTTYNWAVQQRRQGRSILAGSADGEEVDYQLSQMSLDNVPLATPRTPT